MNKEQSITTFILCIGISTGTAQQLLYIVSFFYCTVLTAIFTSSSILVIVAVYLGTSEINKVQAYVIEVLSASVLGE